MARIPQVSRESVRAELRDIFDEVTSGSGGVGTGPMSVLKHSPEMARRALPLFNYLRNESSVPKKLRELAMITTARATDCPYIWNAHAGFAREEGLSDALVDALRDNQPLPPMPPDETAVFNFAMELFQTRRVTSETFQLVHDLLGSQGLAELTTLLGYYTMLAFNANAVELDLPHDLVEPPLPV
ncbi:MAG: carboxymuconolactone decarboxylase family protein [Chloroflexi bacterium]|nr:carboxymuconolactone decarboxylase family protein [Chloroflexota bacterium]MDA1220134.1 carboxymuconolactone decarboxylase family protein [Chloroflexota bacterium]